MKGEARHWPILFAAFLTQALTHGFAGCMGVFYVEWKKAFAADLPGDGSGILGWLSSSFMGVLLSTGPVSGALAHHYGIRPVVMAGGLLSTMGLFISSFAESVYLLFFTVPLMTGFGCGLSYAASLSILTQYFHKHFGLANGIASAGISIGVMTLPFIAQGLINYYFTWRIAIMIFAGIQAQVMVCGALMKPLQQPCQMKGRIATTEHCETEHAEGIVTSELCTFTKISDEGNGSIETVVLHGRDSMTAPRRGRFRAALDNLGISLLWTNRVYACALPMFCFSGGTYSTTLIYIKERANQAGIPDFQSTLLISIMGFSGFFARVGHGHLIDAKIFHLTTIYCFANFQAALSVVMISVFDHYAVFVTCAAAIGFSAGLYIALNTVFVKNIVGLRHFPGGNGLTLLGIAVAIMSTIALTGFLLDYTGDYLAGFLYAGLLQSLSGLTCLINHFVWTRCIKDPRWPPPLPPTCRGGHHDECQFPDSS